jgi:hypothetical protein
MSNVTFGKQGFAEQSIDRANPIMSMNMVVFEQFVKQIKDGIPRRGRRPKVKAVNVSFFLTDSIPPKLVIDALLEDGLWISKHGGSGPPESLFPIHT